MLDKAAIGRQERKLRSIRETIASITSLISEGAVAIRASKALNRGDFLATGMDIMDSLTETPYALVHEAVGLADAP